MTQYVISKRLLIVAALLVLCTAMYVQAQTLQTVDKEGNSIPYATVMTTEATLIGTTGLDGTIDNLQGAKTVIVTHVAYKPKTVNVQEGRQRVVLEDALFDLPELTVTKKDYTYLQVYYRVVACNKEGVQYYRSGISNNFLNKKKGKQETSKQHIVMARSKILKMALNMFIGGKIDDYAKMHLDPVEKTLRELFPKQGLKFTGNGSGRKSIVNKYGTIGSVIDKNGQRRYSFDLHDAILHEIQAGGNKKDIEKARKRDAEAKNRVSSSYRAYSIDENGKYNPEDFLMEQHTLSFDSESQGHTVIILDYYATNRSYVSKEEMKSIKKKSKVKMSYSYLQNFERQHNIPPLAPQILSKVKALTSQ